MNKEELKMLEESGFSGMESVKNLRNSCKAIPEAKGLYVVLRSMTPEMPEFLEKGTGGLYEGKDMNYPVEKLENKWIKDTSIIYIGKTDNSLRKRIRTYMRHGMGSDVSHRGGRSIWQLPDAENLMVAWKVLTPMDNARDAEIKMMKEFMSVHGRLPFANMTN